MFDVRTIVAPRGASFRAIIAAMRFGSSREVQAITRSAFGDPRLLQRAAGSRRCPSRCATSKRYASAVTRDSSMSTTVSSCSACNDSTIVEPTCPAPITKIFTPR